LGLWEQAPVRNVGSQNSFNTLVEGGSRHNDIVTS